MKIKEEKWEEFVKLFNERIQSNIRCSEDDKFYYYDEENDSFGVNKKDYSLSFTGNSNRNIDYYIKELQLEDFVTND